MTSTDMDCLFCKIAAELVPADLVYKDDLVVAFRDINPQAPTHILIISKEHISKPADLNDSHSALLSQMFKTANKIALDENISEKGYRLVINNGKGAGQSVFHLHLHLLGGRPMNWPPG